MGQRPGEFLFRKYIEGPPQGGLGGETARVKAWRPACPLRPKNGKFFDPSFFDLLVHLGAILPPTWPPKLDLGAILGAETHPKCVENRPKNALQMNLKI